MKKYADLKRDFEALPRYLQVVVTILFLIPIWNLGITGFPWDIYEFHGLWVAILQFTAFQLVPFLLALTLLTRSFFFLLLYALEVCGIFLFAYYGDEYQPFEITFAQWCVVIGMYFILLVLLNKNLLLTMMAGKTRLWRRTPRIYVNAPLRLMKDGAGGSIPVVMENCSINGMGVTGDSRCIKEFLIDKQRDCELLFAAPFGGSEESIRGRLVYNAGAGLLGNMGVYIDDDGQMIRFIQSLGLRRGGHLFANIYGYFWSFPRFRTSILFLYCGIIFLLLAMPVISEL